MAAAAVFVRYGVPEIPSQPAKTAQAVAAATAANKGRMCFMK